MLEARIKKRYPQGAGFAGFDLDVTFSAGKGITVLFGPSGSGKTLTLDAIAGFVCPSEGRIMLDDRILYDGGTHVHLPPRERQCGYVFQNYALFPHMSLRKNLEFAVENKPRLDRHRLVNEMLERFHLTEVAGRRPHQLSGGQKQRCSIARALIGAPRLLLLDEPARGLDPSLRGELYDALREIPAAFGTPILLVTHDLAECFELATEMLIVREGRIAQSGPPRRIFDQPATVDIARSLGLYNLLPVEIRALDPGRNSSRLRIDEFEITGPYFPGRLIGDRAWLYIRPEQLSASPRNGRLSPNQIPATLTRVVEQPGRTRLQFAGDLTVEALAVDPDALRNPDWCIQFPQSGLKLV